MPYTVEEGFRVFLGSLTPSIGESGAAQRHRQSIQDCLKSNFGLNAFFRSGSFGSGTSVRSHSDVDYIASIPRENIPQNSISFLTKVRAALDRRFPYTGVRVKTPAVVVPFGTDASETTEVIPADFIRRTQQGHRIYEIADGSGSWMRTSPESHNAYVAAVNSRLSNKVKPLIRFLKAWKYFNNVPVSSFYLELRCARYASAESSIIYSIDIKNVFKLLWDRQLSAIQDPVGISGYVYACSTEAQKINSLAKLETALNRAYKARAAEQEDKPREAFYWWDRVFNGYFPRYG